MKKHRLSILIGLAIVLAVLLWLDNASNGNNASYQSSALVNSNRVTHVATQIDGTSDRFVASNENPLSFLRAEDLRQTVDRPLFAPNRRPPTQKRRTVVRAPATAVAPHRPRNTYKLLGIIRSQGRSIALLSGGKNGLNFRVETGDLIGGWYVKDVKEKQIILEQNNGQVVLSIP